MQRSSLDLLEELSQRERPENAHLADTMNQTRRIDHPASWIRTHPPKMVLAWLTLQLNLPHGILSIVGFIFLCIAVFFLAGMGWGFAAIGVCFLFVDWMRDRDSDEEDSG